MLNSKCAYVNCFVIRDEWQAMAQVVDTLRKKTEVSVSMPGRVVGSFKLIYSFYPLSVALRSTQPVKKMNTKEFH